LFCCAAALEIEDQTGIAEQRNLLGVFEGDHQFAALLTLPYSIQSGRTFIANSAKTAKTTPPIMTWFRLKPR
jgi:hypothetical protein